MGVQSDRWIRQMAEEHGMIHPFEPHQIRKISGKPVISYGTSSYGYDVRCSTEFKIFTNINSVIVDPKNFDENSFIDIHSEVCIIPPNSFALARTVEYFKIPRDVLVICVGKSTYARCGIIVNVTPLEPCFSSDTQILTQRGWKYFSDIVIGTEVLTMNPETGIAEWQAVERIQMYWYTGYLLHFYGRSVDLLVTPDHYLYVSKKSTASMKTGWGEWYREKAEVVFGQKNYRMNRTVHWKGVDISDKIMIGDHLYNTGDFLLFLGIFLQKGFCAKDNKGNDSVHIDGSDKVYFPTIHALFSRLSYQHSGAGPHFQIVDKGLYDFLSPLGNRYERYIPPWIKELSSDKLAILLNGLETTRRLSGAYVYTTVSSRLADDIQEIIFKVGGAAVVRSVNRNMPVQQVNGEVSVETHTCYEIRRSYCQLRPFLTSYKKVPYTGRVYDVTVPNHTLFVQRNGKPVWSGNCWEGHVTLEFSNTTPLPAKVYANEGVAQVLFLSAKEPCETSYRDRGGKYQGQTGVTLPKA